jgi:hypothetical protein
MLGLVLLLVVMAPVLQLLVLVLRLLPRPPYVRLHFHQPKRRREEGCSHFDSRPSFLLLLDLSAKHPILLPPLLEISFPVLTLVNILNGLRIPAYRDKALQLLHCTHRLRKLASQTHNLYP